MDRSEGELIKLNTDTGFLKIIAALSMLIDHVGRAFFSSHIEWRIAGRLAFPIFAFCVVIGCVYTSNIRRYFMRLLVFAVISQAPFVLCVYTNPAAFLRNLFYLNVIFTLLLGAVAVYGLMDFQKRWWLTVLSLLLSAFIKSDYQLYGVVLMMVMYLFHNNRLLWTLATGALLVFPVFVGSVPVNVMGISVNVQSFAALSLPLMLIRTHTRLNAGKYFFYVFYPAHMLVIFLVRLHFRV